VFVGLWYTFQSLNIFVVGSSYLNKLINGQAFLSGLVYFLVEYLPRREQLLPKTMDHRRQSEKST